MELYNTKDSQVKPSVVMLVYGQGGVGKTTFASTAPKPILADCENGAKYFGLRGISMPVARIRMWSEMGEFLKLVSESDEYETIIIDPIGELMDMLKRFMIGLNDSKLAQRDGSPTMAGWGWLKKTLKDYIKAIRNTGKNVIIIAHVEEKQDEERIVKRPKVETKLSDDLIALVDIVGYFTVANKDGEDKRIIVVDPSSDKYIAKDRTGQLGKVIPPNFAEIVHACQGTKTYSWSKPVDDKKEPEEKEEDNVDTEQLDETESGVPTGAYGNASMAETKKNKVADLKKKASKKKTK